MFKTRKFWLFLALGVSACLWQAGYRVRAQKAAESNRAAGPAQTTQNSDIPEPGLIIKGQSKSYEGVSGNAGKASVVDFKVIAKKPVNIKRRTKDGDGPEPDVDFMPAPDGWQRAAPAPGTKPQAPIDTAKHILPGVPAPAPSSSFLASEDEDMDIPPDTHGAVGPNHIVSATNTRIRIQSRTGTVLSTTGLSTFWSSLGTLSVFDPRVLYDINSGRFIVSAVANAESASSSLLIGVSLTSDPTGQWRLFSVDADAADQAWADYPSVGFNNQWITVQVNMFGNPGSPTPGSFVRTQVYAFTKSTIYNNNSAPFTLFSRSDIGSTQAPAVTYDTTDTQYLLQRFNSTDGTLRIYTITNPATPVLTDTGLTPVSPVNWSTTPPRGASVSDFARQAGSLSYIQNGDSRMQSVVYRNGSLWGAHTIFYPAGGAATRSAVQWWQLNPTNGTVQQRGVVDDTTGNNFYAYPSITVNVNNDALLGYSRFSLTQFASANYSFRAGGDPANTMREDAVMKAGEGFYEKRFSGAANRWGDYSAAGVDPNNGVDMWTVQEYAATPTGNDVEDGRWGTWWIQVRADGTVAGPATPPQTAPVPTPIPGVPTNDNFANARALPNCSGSVTDNNFSATKENGEPAHVPPPDNNAGGKSIWYRWQAPISGQVTFTTDGSNFDTVLAAYTGSSVAALTDKAHDDDGGPGATSSITFSADNGTVYFIAVDGYLANGIVGAGDVILGWTLANTSCAPNAVIQFTRPLYNTLESTGAAVITVQRQGSTFGASSVDYRTTDGSALQRTDYTVSSGTIAFAANEKLKTFAIPITDDAYVENTENLTLTLSNPVNAGLGPNTTATLNIINNEAAESPTNPINTSRFFVRQQYADFLSREPDQGGFDFWTGELTSRTEPALFSRRHEVSNAFFFELEYQQTGAYVYRLYRAAYGNTQPFPNGSGDNDANPYCQQAGCPVRAAHLPAYARFVDDRARVVGGANLAQAQINFANTFVGRAEFTARYPASLATGAQFVDAVLATLNSFGVNLSSQRSGLIARYDSAGGGNAGRGEVMFRLAVSNAAPIDNSVFINAEYNRAFVATQYFGYLRRDADMPGFNFWAAILNRFPPRTQASQFAMVCAFINSGEYQQRFSPLVPRNDSGCPPAP